MNRTTALTDAIKRTSAYYIEALDAIDKPGYDFNLCAETALRSMQEQVELNKEYQKHLDAGTLLDEIEVFTKTVWNTEPYALVEYWRLLPRHTEPETLSGYRGDMDFLDAERNRAMQWPNAVYVSPGCFDMSVSESYKQSDDMYRCYFASHMPALSTEQRRQDEQV